MRLTSGYLCHPSPPRPDLPHFIGQSNRHLNGYLNVRRLLQLPTFAEILALVALGRLREHYSCSIDWVIGPAYTSHNFGFCLANFLSARHGIVEKDVQGKATQWSGEKIKGWVLVVNDVMTTPNGSTYDAKQAVIRNSGAALKFVPHAVILANRSGYRYLIDGTKVISCYEFPELQSYFPDDCLLCKIGSKAIKMPKSEWDNIAGEWKKKMG